MYNYLNNPLLIEYQKEFNSDIQYTDLSQVFKIKGINFYFRITLDKKNNFQLNYYGREIIFPDYLITNYLLKKKVYDYLDSLIIKYKINKCNVKVNLLHDDTYVDCKNKNIINEMYIDLKNSENTILRNFAQRHRTILNKNYEQSK